MSAAAAPRRAGPPDGQRAEALPRGHGSAVGTKRPRPRTAPRDTPMTDAGDQPVETRSRRGDLATRVRDGGVAGWRAFQRLTQLSFPRCYPIVQFPNLPLILAFVSGLAAHYTHGQEHADFQAVSYLSMAVWAYLELFQGVNMFRRLLGLAYMISTVVHLAGALH